MNKKRPVSLGEKPAFRGAYKYRRCLIPADGFFEWQPVGGMWVEADCNLPSGESLTLEPLQRSKRRLGLKHFDPCTILLNNDLSAGIPPVLENLHEQYLLPPLHAGWAVRRKSRHFQSYEEVAKKFAKLLGMDPWLINPMYTQCGKVNFGEGDGIECIKSNAEALIAKGCTVQLEALAATAEASEEASG